MGNSIAATSAGNGLWTCGLSLADFEAPSNETPVAQAARETVAVALELAHIDIRGGDLLLADEAAGDSVVAQRRRCGAGCASMRRTRGSGLA